MTLITAIKLTDDYYNDAMQYPSTSVFFTNRSRQSSVTSNSQENLMAAAAAQMRLQQQQQQQELERRGSNTLTRKNSGIPQFQSPIKAGNKHAQISTW